jgi:sporulation protein YunB
MAGRIRLPRGRTIALLLAFFAASVLVCVALEHRAGPQVRALAENLAKQQASAAISTAVEQVLVEEQVTYESLVGYGSDSAGIRSIQTNALEVNLIRAKINDAVEQAVTLRHGRLRLPLGALLGSDLFAGAGPNIVVPLAMTGHALSDIRSDLSSSGVNQTMHRILMDLHVSLSVILPGGLDTSEITMTVCLAETVIVGQVPNGLITQK